MRYGGGRHYKFIGRKQQDRFALELAVEDPGQIIPKGTSRGFSRSST